MASANLSTYNSALKQTWTENTLAEQLYQGDDLLSKIEKTKRFQVGRQAVTPIHTGRNGGYTALGAGGGTLNTAGNQGSAQAVWNYAHHHQPIAIEGELIDGTVDNALTVVNAIDTEVTLGLADMRRSLSRQLVTNGDAQIAVMGVTGASTTVVLNVIDGKNATARGWLYPGQLIDIGTAANPVLRANGVTILTVDDTPTAPTFTVAVAITTAITDQVSHKGSRTATPAVFEMNGLKNIVNASSTLGGITVASQGSWKAANVDSTVQALTLPLVYDQIRLIKQKTGVKPDTIWSGFKQNERLYQLLQTQVRYAGDTGLATGNTAVSVGGVPVEENFDIKDEEMYFLTMKNLFICATDKPYWQNAVTGGEILAWIQGTDSYGAKITYRIQPVTNRRNAHAALLGLT